MAASPSLPLSTTFDLATVTVEGLVEVLPDIGLFSAEDIIKWRDDNGTFPDADTLVSKLGVDAELAARIGAVAKASLAEAAPESPVGPPLLSLVSPPSVPPVPSVAPAGAVVGDEDVEDVPDEPAPTATPPSPPPLISAPAPAVKSVAPPAPSAKSVAPAEPAVSSAPSVEPKLRRGAKVLVGALVALNLAGVLGAAGLHFEQRRTRLPIAALSAHVSELDADHAAALAHTTETRAKVDETRAKVDETRASIDETRASIHETRVKLDETRAKLDETRDRLDLQAKDIAVTRAALATAEQHRKDEERRAREHDAQEEREAAALAARTLRLEKKTFTLREAVKVLEAVEAQAEPPPTP